MDVIGLVGGLFKPATELIKQFKISPAEAKEFEVKLVEIKNNMSLKLLDYESQLLKSKASIITAEAQGQSWMQRNWRPVTMITFLALVVFDSFGWLANPLADDAWDLLKIGLGGYVVGRSAEKIAPQLRKK